MDAYVAAFDEYVQNMECENEKGALDYSINSLSLEKFIKWKFPDIEPVCIEMWIWFWMNLNVMD